jgi:hypothetical protein
MVLKRGWLAAIGVSAVGLAGLAWSGPSAAQQYRADEVLNLDLSRAVLSPRPLGPPASFTRGPLDVTADRGNDAAQAKAEFLFDPKPVATAAVHVNGHPTAAVHARSQSRAMVHVGSKPPIRTAFKSAAPRMRVAHARPEQQHPPAPRALVALHRRNPMEAQARDTAIQVWPCRSGGICNWKR